MLVKVSLSFIDLKIFIAYTNELCDAFNKKTTYSKLKPFQKAKIKAHYSEVFKLNNKLNIKQFCWDITKRKNLRQFNFTYMQAYVLLINFDRKTAPTQYLIINDKIEHFAKQLTV